LDAARSRKLEIEEDARMYHCNMLTNVRLPVIMMTRAPLSETRMQVRAMTTLPVDYALTLSSLFCSRARLGH
jgi:hypothetical protein